MSSTNFTCVLTLHDGTSQQHLLECLKSLSNQTSRPNQTIAVIDGQLPVEKLGYLQELFCSFSDCLGLETLQLPENVGPGIARNAGVQNAIHDLVAIMDSDDVCRPDRFEVQLGQFVKLPDLVLCGGYIQEFHVLPGDEVTIRKVPQSGAQIKRFLRTRSPLNNVTAMFRKPEFLALGGYPNKRTSEDYQLWARFIGKGHKLKNIGKILVDVRINRTHFRKRHGISVFLDDLETQRELLDLGLIGWGDFCKNLLFYSLFRVTPSFCSKAIYKRLLRSRCQRQK